ncbi:MAG: hypothetical protein RLN88_09095 [Ekhidna sp.]|uniref:hypothetical protein n=1 Tax=Ekhidna sp. TaxID=2608089 RepID=UPI0032EBB395
MKGRNIYYLLFAAVTITAIVIYLKIDREKKKQNPQITELAVEPDLLMNTADRYQHDGKRLTAIEFLEDAISMMRLLEKDGDSVSMRAIEVAIHDLEVVEEHIKAEDINDDLMYEAFADAMNSLAFASLRISEEYIREGKEEEAMVTLEHAMDHLQNSIKYARGQQKEDEIRIVQHLNEIIENHLESDISRIDEVMAEIDSVVQAHVIQ